MIFWMIFLSASSPHSVHCVQTAGCNLQGLLWQTAVFKGVITHTHRTQKSDGTWQKNNILTLIKAFTQKTKHITYNERRPRSGDKIPYVGNQASFLFAKSFVLPVMKFFYFFFLKKGKVLSKRFHKVGGIFRSKISLHALRFPQMICRV